jgi:hypothetical protein
MKGAPRQLEQGNIYFIQEEESGPIKIGFSTDLRTLRTRLTHMQVDNPRPLRCLATLAGTGGDEYALHTRFKLYQIRGEWFEPAQELLDYIGAMATPYRWVRKDKWAD